MKIIDCSAIREAMLNEAKTAVDKIVNETGKRLKLVVASVGEDHASKVYIRNKMKTCESVGIDCEHVDLPEDIQFVDLQQILMKYVIEQSTTGLMLQLPLPKHLQPYQRKLLDTIPWFKDVDGLCSTNIAKLYTKDEGLFPCTAIGCMRILKSIRKDLTGLNAVVCGRSDLIGRPIAQLLLNENCTVTTVHSKTKNLKEITKQADIVVCAIGKAKYFDKSYFKDDVIVLDVGVNRKGDSKKICGDVDLESLEETNIAVTPTPGGTGLGTTSSLILNIIKAWEIQNEATN